MTRTKWIQWAEELEEVIAEIAPDTLQAEPAKLGPTHPLTRLVSVVNEMKEEFVGPSVPLRVLSTPIEDIGFSHRTYNCLKKGVPWGPGINTVGELLGYTKTQLREIHAFGPKSLQEVVETLKNDFGFELKP